VTSISDCETERRNAEVSAPSTRGPILQEREFRKKPQRVDGSYSQVVISRWTLKDVQRPIELMSNPKSLDDSHVITFALKPTDATLIYEGREFFHGRVPRQSLLMTGPYQAIRTIKRHLLMGFACTCHNLCWLNVLRKRTSGRRRP
jgi:hypothetical protein